MDTDLTPSELPWTGERLVTCVTDHTAIEHLHRYSIALTLAAGKRVLDIASGEGYGSHLLAQIAEHVTGVDICSESVQHAACKYRRDNLEFKVGDCAAIPVESSSVDLVVSFETIEHHDKHDEMMKEIKRILRPNGILLLSSPNKHIYSDVPKGANPFHVKELYQDELESLLHAHFKSHQLLGQLMCEGSVIFPIDPSAVGKIEVMEGDYRGTDRRAWADQVYYFIAIATDAAELPPTPMGVYDGKKLQPSRGEVATRMNHLQWTVDTQEKTINHLQWTIDRQQWTIDQHQWTIDQHQRTIDQHQRTIDQHIHEYETAIATLGEKEKEILAVIAWNDELHALLKASEAELLKATTSRTMRLGRRIERIADRLAPPKSVRRRLCRTMIRSLQRLRKGLNAFKKRIFQKLSSMKSPTR